MAEITNKNNERIKEVLRDINSQAEVNEGYLVGLLWYNPEKYYGKYSDILTQDHFIKENWGFMYNLGQELYKSGVLTFDDITVMKKVKSDGIEELFDEYGGFDIVDDVINIVKQGESNIDYYADSVLRNFSIRNLYKLFGAKVLLETPDYPFKSMDKDSLIMYWADKMNEIALGSSSNNYEVEDLYIDADEFLRKLEEDSDEMLKLSHSVMWNSISQGIPRGAVTMVGGFGNSGKALSCITKIPTPNGWTTMGEVKVGDEIFGQDGKPTKVLWKSPIYTDHDVYKMTFSDKEVIYADADHQWNVKTDHSVSMWRKNKKIVDGDKKILDGGYYTTTTEDIAKDAVCRRKDNKGNVYKYSVPLNEAIECSEKELPISPYVFGLWLGDGYSSGRKISTFNDDVEEIVEYIRDCGWDASVEEEKDGRNSKKVCLDNKADNGQYLINVILKELGVFNNKHIPEIYMRSSIEQRMELLQGLMDSDGTVDNKMGCAEWSQKDEVLTDQFCELLASLGFRYSKNKRKTKCQSGEFESFRVCFFTSKTKPAFKLQRYIDRLPEKNSQRQERKSIVSVELVESIPVQCLAVDNEDSLFLVGEHMTVTHNSSITADKFTMACIENQERMIVLLNEEDSQSYRQKILLSILWREGVYVDRKKMVRGELSETEKDKVREAFKKLSEYMDGDESMIKVVFMEKYIMEDLEKIIRAWANKGYHNLLIDTHKVSEESKHHARWETFVEDMKTIYRITRKNAGGCNLRTVVTFQLADSAINNRVLDFDAIGEGKAAKNEASIVYMFRAVWSDEFEGENKEIRYYTLHKQADGSYRKERNQTLKKTNKNGDQNIYYLVFTPKNRSGSTNTTGQDVLILRPEFHKNRFVEVGWAENIKDDKSSRR